MKKAVFVVGLLGAMLVAVPVYAQSGQQEEKSVTMDKSKQHEDKFVGRLTRDLKLTPEQVTQVKTIVHEQHAKMKSHRDETRQRIESVLTPEQASQFKAMKQEHHGHKAGTMKPNAQVESLPSGAGSSNI